MVVVIKTADKFQEVLEAKTSFEMNKTGFENSRDSSSVETDVELKDNAKYTQTSNGKFSVVSKIGNTFVYLNVDEKCKDDAKEILKELGY